MTIAVAYLTSEGVVFGTDSTTTVGSHRGGVGQLLNYAQKLFEVGENSRFGICTWGAGKIEDVSHRTLIARLADELDLEKAKVSDVTDAFKNIVAKEYGDGKKTKKVGYLVGGWNPGTHLPECYHILFDVNNQPKCNPMNIGEAIFFGCPEFSIRVFRGFDSKLPQRLFIELKKRKITVEKGKFVDVFNEAFDKAVAPLTSTGFRDLPIREAIDFVHTYLHITIKAFKFRTGPPICGGPIEIAFISTDRKFRWVCHKSFERAIYEQEV